MEHLVEKASVLIEALPYIKKFRGKEILIKYGGAAMDNPEIRKNVLEDLVFMNYVGIRPILIHGGGPAITEKLKEKGVVTQFVNGLRVTDKATIDVVRETLADLNKSIVHDINQLGARAIGLSGHDNEILNVKKHTKNGDVGFVGDVTSVNIMPLKDLTEFNIIPVIYPLGIDEAGDTFNVNADEAAAKIAVAMQVQKIIILTNVKGIMRDPKDDATLISSLHVDEVETLIRNKVISGGMIPKIGAGITAIQGGVKKAHIIDGRIKHSLLLEIFTDQGIGTEIVL
ncbi:MAG: acetylglutamate kinase [Candidatus Omnitrophica bacterium]|nr:acetylglutamate kinase [Candidatus Omnitrophota bacterium]